MLQIMQTQAGIPVYRVWGSDNIAYGPFELPALVAWIKQKRVLANTWVFASEAGAWQKASQLAELKMFFKEKPSGAAPAAGAGPSLESVKPENLRRIKIFAEMDPTQLESFLAYMELVRIRKFAHLFHKGETGDAMYSILEGEMRAMNMADGKETTLFTLHPGDSFGEIALLIQTPRSSDIVANEDSLLLKLPAAAFDKVVREAPALAAPFLLAIARVMTNRSLELGRKYESSVRSARVVSALYP